MARAKEGLGEENVVLVYFDEVSDGSFVRKIEARLGCSLGIDHTTGWSNKHYSVRYEVQAADGDAALILKRGGRVARRWPISEIGWPAACNALAASQYWSRYVPKSEYEKIYQKLYKEMDLESVGIDRKRLFHAGDVFHAP